MNAFITVIPLLLIRYGLLGIVNKDAQKRAGIFAPVVGIEKTAFLVYQLTSISIFIYLFFLRITTNSSWLAVGLILYCMGIVIYTAAVLDYAKPKRNGINVDGLYRVSRNPMYVAYFIYFLGCVFLTHSWVLLLLLACFQISSHWIILSEERWCIGKFGNEYSRYMNRVRRYL